MPTYDYFCESNGRTAGAVLTGKGAASAPPCETGMCCGGGACGLP